MFNKWFIITLVLTSQPTLILCQNLWHTPQLLSQRVCVVTPKTSPFWGMTQTIFATGSERYCTGTDIIVGGKEKCQQHPNDSVLRINKTHALNSQEDYQSVAEGKSSNPGRHSGKPEFIQKGSDPSLRYNNWQGRKYLMHKHWMNDVGCSRYPICWISLLTVALSFCSSYIYSLYLSSVLEQKKCSIYTSIYFAFVHMAEAKMYLTQRVVCKLFFPRVVKLVALTK